MPGLETVSQGAIYAFLYNGRHSGGNLSNASIDAGEVTGGTPWGSGVAPAPA